MFASFHLNSFDLLMMADAMRRPGWSAEERKKNLVARSPKLNMIPIRWMHANAARV